MKRIRVAQSLPTDATYDEMNSPVGALTLITSAAGLHAIFWDTDCENLVYKKMIGGLVLCQKSFCAFIPNDNVNFFLPLIL